MGELAEDFRFMDEERKKKKARLEPDRMAYAAKLLRDEGHEVISTEPGEITVNGFIKVFPYTGWWSGKSVGSGRGIHELVKKLKENSR